MEDSNIEAFNQVQGLAILNACRPITPSMGYAMPPRLVMEANTCSSNRVSHTESVRNSQWVSTWPDVEVTYDLGTASHLRDSYCLIWLCAPAGVRFGCWQETPY
jgi:hypothetical protein